MGRYLLRRLLISTVVIWGVLTAVFVVVRVVPGDPAALILGSSATAELVEQVRAEMGLDRPLPVQYVSFVGQAASLDFGRSLYFRQPVARLIGQRYLPTLQLALGAMALSVLIALPLGIWAGLRPGSGADGLINSVTMIGQSLPTFWVGLMVILLFSYILRVLPPFGYGSPAHLIGPALTLALGLSALVARLVRAGMIETMRADYVRTARSKGVGESVVVFKHALRNTLIPIITIMGLQLGFLLSGAVVVETVFAWPGLGSLVVEALLNRDYTVVQGVTLVIATTFVVVNLLVDVLYAYVDPRIRYT